MSDKKWKMIDLFSGLGGASEAFLNNGWEVWRGDANELFFNKDSEYYVKDTVKWDAYKDKVPTDSIDFLWASPPCQQFSVAYNSLRSKADREGKEFHPDMSLIMITAKIIEIVKPRFWALENVNGAQEFLNPIFGKYRIKLGSAIIWGNFPIVGFDARENGFKEKIWEIDSPIRANIRAKMPYWLSDQMRVAVQYQMMLSDFEDSLSDVSWAWKHD